MASFNVVVVGAGRIGLELAHTLTGSGDFAVSLVEVNDRAEDRARALGFNVLGVDSSHASDIERLLDDHAADVVVAAVPAGQCAAVAKAAQASGTSYIDLVEDPTQAVADFAQGTSGTFLSGCGIAPGLITPLLLDALANSPWARSAQVSIGILPRSPKNRLGYELSWDVSGLIDEYMRPGIAIIDGALVEISARSQYRVIPIESAVYESFATGGAGMGLARHLAGRLDELSLGTMRRQGHLDYMNFLIEDLGLSERRYLLDTLLRNGVPRCDDDEVLILISLSSDEREERHFYKISSEAGADGKTALAGPKVAASHVCAMIDLLREGAIDMPGLVPQESLKPRLVLDNRFLAWIRDAKTQIL